MTEPSAMASPFPRPPDLVQEQFERAAHLAGLEDPSKSERVAFGLLQRPWIPSSCSPDLRFLIYGWLDEVVAWINEDCLWRTERAVPACWEQHPHIVHELAVVATLRWHAELALTPAAMEDWLRFTLPQFLDRMATRVGETGCPPGAHQPHPGSSRNDAYRDARSLRASRREQDVSAGS
ncbi:MAG: hypothetical protein ACSLEW_13950 [Nocardioides sp.]